MTHVPKLAKSGPVHNTRTVILKVVAHEDEAERLRMAARGAGATLSGWLRTIGLREAHILTARTRLQASLDEIRDILETTDAR